MKNTAYILSSLIGLLFLFSCNTDNKDVFLHAEGNEPPQFKNYAGGNYVLTKETEFNTFEVFEWTPADYGPVAVRYDIQMALDGTDFASPVTLVSGLNATSQRFTVRDIDKTVLALDNSGDEVAVQVRIKSYLYLNKSTVMPLDPLFSDPVTLTVTPYIDSYVPPVPGLYIIGNMQGWSNSNTDFQFFRDDSDPLSGIYTYTGIIKLDNLTDGGIDTYFKFADDNMLGSWDLYRPDTQGTMSGSLQIGGDPAFKFTEAAYYELKADIKAGTFQFTKLPNPAITYTYISLIGGFNGWGGDLDLTPSAYDPHIWVLDGANIPISGELKFRANHDWPVNWGGSGFPYGKGVQDGPNISLDAGTYKVQFNDITGQYIFMPK